MVSLSHTVTLKQVMSNTAGIFMKSKEIFKLLNRKMCMFRCLGKVYNCPRKVLFADLSLSSSQLPLCDFTSSPTVFIKDTLTFLLTQLPWSQRWDIVIFVIVINSLFNISCRLLRIHVVFMWMSQVLPQEFHCNPALLKSNWHHGLIELRTFEKAKSSFC